MMELLQKYKTLIIVLVLIVIGFVLYSLFFTSGNDGSVLVSQKPSGAAREGNELPILLVNLKSIRLDKALFDDAAFQSLTDFGQELIPQPTGRPNPFAPVGTGE
ncbi:MAG: hypothetical protein OQJ98_00460 [Candidatus Pacebacteria bacterium]|nr:hypothetical protein [Candidatus Paceibacterota bacterium]